MGGSTEGQPRSNLQPTHTEKCDAAEWGAEIVVVKIRTYGHSPVADLRGRRHWSTRGILAAPAQPHQWESKGSGAFRSYARGDDADPFDPATSFVARLHRDLATRGFEVWFDRIAMPSRGLTFHQEIQDAVAACERLVLVVGPKATVSDYVRQEWQFALEADMAVTPILRQGDYPLVPNELKLLHCEDFRDDTSVSIRRSKGRIIVATLN